MARLRGPHELKDPIVIYQGESWKPQFDVTDGRSTHAAKFGAPVPIPATAKGVLRVNINGDLKTRDTSISGDGEKGASHFLFFVAGTVTAGWPIGLFNFEVEYIDGDPTVDDNRLVAHGKIQVFAKPSDR